MLHHHQYHLSSYLNGHLRGLPLVGFVKLNSEPGTVYSVLNAYIDIIPEGLKFYREHSVLIVEHNGKKIVALKGFFTNKENPATFIVDRADGKTKSMITINSTIVDENGRNHVIPLEPLLVTNSELNTISPTPASVNIEAAPEEPDFFADNWVWFAVGGAIIFTGVVAGGFSGNDSSTDAPKPDAVRLTLKSVKAIGNTIVLTYDEALDGDHLPEASTFAIQVIGGANNPVTAVAISDSGDAIILTLTNPIAKGSNFTIAYTDPTTGDDANAIQDEQGNDASTFNGKTGLVVDGYIQGAQLYADYDNNGIAEDNEILEGVITDEFGRFFLTTDINAPLIAVGGTNTDTGIENTLTMRAPEGATVINPITTVVQQYLNDNEGTSLEQAETAVKEILGIALPVGERLSDYEPISSKNQEMQEIAAQIVEVAMQAETTKAGDGSIVFENIAAAKAPLDLTTADDVTAITKGTGITAETVQALVTQTTNIKDTDTIADIATQQKSLIVALKDDTGLEDDDLNSSVGTIEVTRKFTGNIQYSIDDGVIWTDDFDAEEGENNLQVRQVDAEGKVLSEITTFAFILDTKAPTQTVSNLGLSDDSGIDALDLITNVASQTITAKLSVSLVVGELLYGSVDGGTIWADITDMAIGTAISWMTDLSEGENSIVFKVRDLAGNGAATSTPIFCMLDTTAPTQTIDNVAFSADAGANASDLITNENEQTITASLSAVLAEDERLYGSADGGANWINITDSVTGTDIVWGDLILRGGSTYPSHILKLLEQGWSGLILGSGDSIRFKVVDLAGNEGVPSDAISYSMDTTAPTLKITDDTDGTATGSVIYTFKFSEEVVDFTVDIIIVRGGTKGTFKTLEDNVYQLTVTPGYGSTTPIEVRVSGFRVEDIAGNQVIGSTEGDIQVVHTRKFIDTSIVVFDMTTGKSSSHSGRKFTDTVTDIYIIFPADSPSSQIPSWKIWSATDDIIDRIKVHLVTFGEGFLEGRFGKPITKVAQRGQNVAFSSKKRAGFSLSQGGLLDRLRDGGTSRMRLWEGDLAIAKGSLAESVPMGRVTSQGLS